MIRYGEEIARVNGTIKQLNNETMTQLEITLTGGEVQGKRVAKKLYKVNDVGRRMIDFVGNLKVVIFRPEDSQLILGSPSIRREYLDSVLEQVDAEYRRSSLVYKKGLRQRNKLLDFIRDGKAQTTQLEYWNRLLVKNGELISQKREELIGFYNEAMNQLNGKTIKQFNNLTIEYDKSPITEMRLQKYAAAELALGATLVGPHRDNLRFKIGDLRKKKIDRDLALFGSRGEQRMALLALKLSELAFVTQKSDGDRPVLLLDDIFSELDHQHREIVLSIIEGQQTIITTADIHLVEKKFLDKMNTIAI